MDADQAFRDEVIAVQCARMCSFARARDIVLERVVRDAAYRERIARQIGDETKAADLISPPAPLACSSGRVAQPAPEPRGHQRPFSPEPWGITPPAQRMRAGR